MKKFDLIPLYPSKTSWNFSKKKEYDDIIKEQHNKFKTLSLKEIFFLNLLNNNNLSDIEPSYMKGGLWIESFGFSNSLCAQAT